MICHSGKRISGTVFIQIQRWQNTKRPHRRNASCFFIKTMLCYHYMSSEILYLFLDNQDRHFIRDLDLELLVCGHAYAKEDLEQFHPFRCDSFFRIYYPLQGSLRIMDCNETVQIRPDKCYLFPANVPFRMLSDGGFTHNWLHFKSELLERQPGFRRILSVPVEPETENIWKEFLEKAQAESSFENVFLAHQLLRRILLPFLMLPEIRNGSSVQKNERFDEVLQYIGTHYMEPLQMSLLAKLMKMDRNSFSMTFRKEFGVSPKEYLTNTRMAKAKELLLSTSWTVKEIALQCGFRDDLFFYRIFKKHIGLSPIQYRKSMYLGD